MSLHRQYIPTTDTAGCIFKLNMNSLASLLLFKRMLLLCSASAKVAMFSGSHPPGAATSLIMEEVFAVSRLVCAAICMEKGCSSILYVPTGELITFLRSLDFRVILRRVVLSYTR